MTRPTLCSPVSLSLIHIFRSQSARLLCAYAYADAGRGESTTDLVFAAHNLIAENGILCAESRLFENEPVLCDVDVEKLCVERMKNTSFDTQSAEDDGYEVVWFSQQQKEKALMRAISRAPFVPEDTACLLYTSPGLRVHSIENCVAPQLGAFFEVFADLRSDVRRFVQFGRGHIVMDFRTGIILSPERFPFAFAVVLNDAVCRLQNRRSRAVILLQTDHLGARKMLFKAENVLDRSAAEPVNALVVIADHTHVPVSYTHLDVYKRQDAAALVTHSFRARHSAVAAGTP